MYGIYDVPMSIEREGVSISVQKEGDTLLYLREGVEGKVQKTLLTSNGGLLINPVEPLNKPKSITPYLFIDFEKALLVEPKAIRRVFLKFPIEIGVYVCVNENYQVLDIFTFAKKKFTLYGDPRNGVICKYWKSDVYQTPPPTDPLQEGVIELSLSSANPDWVEVKKAVFNAYGMKIYYSDNMVSMRAEMRLKTGNVAETDFIDSPLESGMKNSLEIYTSRKLSITSTRFMMEFGI